MGVGRRYRAAVMAMAAAALGITAAGCTAGDPDRPPTASPTAPPRSPAQQWADDFGGSYFVGGDVIAVAWGDTAPAAAPGARTGGVERDEAFPVSAFEVACFDGPDVRFTFEVAWTDATTTVGEETVPCVAGPVEVRLPDGAAHGDAQSLSFDVIRDPVTAYVVVVRGLRPLPTSGV